MGVETEKMIAEVTRYGCLDMQVCVPMDWSDDEVQTFAEVEYPCGTENGWQIRQEGDKDLAGMPERNPCVRRAGFVHVVLDA